MAEPQQKNHATAHDSVCKPVQNGGLAKTLNSVRTVPGARNPFVTRQHEGSSGFNPSGNSAASSGAQADRK